MSEATSQSSAAKMRRISETANEENLDRLQSLLERQHRRGELPARAAGAVSLNPES
jgi:hypothetical protein